LPFPELVEELRVALRGVNEEISKLEKKWEVVRRPSRGASAPFGLREERRDDLKSPPSHRTKDPLTLQIEAFPPHSMPVFPGPSKHQRRILRKAISVEDMLAKVKTATSDASERADSVGEEKEGAPAQPKKGASWLEIVGPIPRVKPVARPPDKQKKPKRKKPSDSGEKAP